MDSKCNKDIDMEVVRVMMILIMILITTKTVNYYAVNDHNDDNDDGE